MQYRIVFVFFVLVLMACGQAGKVPEGVMQKEEMRDVLLDMTMADAFSTNNEDPRTPMPDSVRRYRVKLYYKQILDLHHLTQAQFQKSYDWYESRPDRLKEVYDMMMEAATADRENLDQETRIKAYLENPFAELPFGQYVLTSKKNGLPTPFLKQLNLPTAHPPVPTPPKPAPPRPKPNGPVPMGSGVMHGKSLPGSVKSLPREGLPGHHKPDFKPKQ
ncbi:DUF4296 domain-containing protein [Chitinophaga sp. LS1]|uniref:DUF4296 domain-containing protein n=1 Tax=Chitinophaga sp. LS1 TaxID=3051176 RepID=UPI002AAC4883|nr:DUF4296 domain-containing protein [Chitinophaga sp. LS1]WPV67380.1 DUF4296 domain-containing protein [Chitinophaga sp. LS1]